MTSPPSTPLPLTAIVLAAGKGTRMRSETPKVLHPVAHRTMLDHVLCTVETAGVEKAATVVVCSSDLHRRPGFLPGRAKAEQREQLGTAHAVLAAKEFLTGGAAPDGQDVLVLFGDTPLIRPETLTRMAQARDAEPKPGVVVLGFEPADPAAYGRLVMREDGALETIVEAKDATPEQLEIGLCNSGVMLIDGAHALSWLERIGNGNAKGEYYLTDIVAIARADGRAAAVVVGDAEEVMGVNDRADLAVAEAILQTRLRNRWLEAGVTMTDPTTVYFAADTTLSEDVTIGPNVVFGPGVVVERGAEIRAFCHLEGATVGANAIVGPFARLRPGAALAENVRIGNFVEIKNAALGPGAKANHLTYLGDSQVGEGANIGAGTITCNYDGVMKYRTSIGAGAFIGSNTALVAPVSIGDGAMVGAGSTISRDVAADDLAISRADQRTLKGGAAKFRAAKLYRKDKS